MTDNQWFIRKKINKKKLHEGNRGEMLKKGEYFYSADDGIINEDEVEEAFPKNNLSDLLYCGDEKEG